MCGNSVWQRNCRRTLSVGLRLISGWKDKKRKGVLSNFASVHYWLTLNLGQTWSKSTSPYYPDRETWFVGLQIRNTVTQWRCNEDKAQLIGLDRESTDWCIARKLNWIPVCNVVSLLPDLWNSRANQRPFGMDGALGTFVTLDVETRLVLGRSLWRAVILCFHSLACQPGVDLGNTYTKYQPTQS